VKIYEITIKPITGFGTPFKGDTIFGHFCWQIAYNENLTGKTLDELLSNYQSKPFVIFSSAYPKFCIGTKYHYALKTPDLPLETIFNLPEDKKELVKMRKEYKAKRWIIIEEGKRISSLKDLDKLNDKELFDKLKSNISDETRKRIKKAGAKSFVADFTQFHNKINRQIGTTGEEGFAPFAVEQQVFLPETELALFVGIDETAINIEQVRMGLERIGEFGFGKDASSGLGRFGLGEDAEVDLSKLVPESINRGMGSDLPNACYTLSPCVPEKDTFSEIYFTPFTRFGRHGDVLAKSTNPFKNPVVMADEGAILKPKNKEIFSKPYIGRAIPKVSKIEPKTVTQGYSLYIPVKLVPENINRRAEV
jgi:CRISPR-associated protein Csm4